LFSFFSFFFFFFFFVFLHFFFLANLLSVVQRLTSSDFPFCILQTFLKTDTRYWRNEHSVENSTNIKLKTKWYTVRTVCPIGHNCWVVANIFNSTLNTIFS
jgi:hypothetical protein